MLICTVNCNNVTVYLIFDQINAVFKGSSDAKFTLQVV